MYGVYFVHFQDPRLKRHLAPEFAKPTMQYLRSRFLRISASPTDCCKCLDATGIFLPLDFSARQDGASGLDLIKRRAWGTKDYSVLLAFIPEGASDGTFSNTLSATTSDFPSCNSTCASLLSLWRNDDLEPNSAT